MLQHQDGKQVEKRRLYRLYMQSKPTGKFRSFTGIEAKEANFSLLCQAGIWYKWMPCEGGE